MFHIIELHCLGFVNVNVVCINVASTDPPAAKVTTLPSTWTDPHAAIVARDEADISNSAG